MHTNDTLELMGTARAMRWFRPDPVPSELIESLVWAATRASSPHNSQPWDIVVVQQRAVRAEIARAIADAVAERDPMPPAADDVDRRIERGVRNLFAHMADAPVYVLLCGRNCYPHDAPNEKYLWSSLGGAAQNLVVAGRSMGLGVAATMLHVLAEPHIREVIDLPADRIIGVTAIVGWPDRPFGPLSRRPLDEIVHHDRW
jgi:nitroreductase